MSNGHSEISFLYGVVTLLSVSYTHLDVYKRQEFNRAVFRQIMKQTLLDQAHFKAQPRHPQLVQRNRL